MTTQLLQSLTETVDEFDVAVLDQWGVLHNGSVPYAHAAEAMVELSRHGKEIVIVSNSGKRAALNLDRISRMGLPAHLISTVVTSQAFDYMIMIAILLTTIVMAMFYDR